MANEITNRHHVLIGKDFSTDASIDDALAKLNASKKDGVSEQELLKLLKDGADYGQLTEREYSQIRQWVQKNHASLTPEARAAFAKFDAAMQAAGGAGTAHRHHSSTDKVVMEGSKLETLMKEIEGLGKPAAPPPPPHKQPSAPPPQPSPPQETGGASSTGKASGKSWMELLMLLLDKIDKKEKDLKAKVEGLGNKKEGDLSKRELMELDQAAKDLHQLFSSVSNIMQVNHDTYKAGSNNLRV